LKKSYFIGGIIIVAALILALFSFKSSLTNYVTINDAKASQHHVQVAGVLKQESIRYNEENNALIFTIKEPTGDELIVQYSKTKPANFENADKIVAIGKYDKTQQVFFADEILVKCPSKYEGRIESE